MKVYVSLPLPFDIGDGPSFNATPIEYPHKTQDQSLLTTYEIANPPMENPNKHVEENIGGFSLYYKLRQNSSLPPYTCHKSQALIHHIKEHQTQVSVLDQLFFPLRIASLHLRHLIGTYTFMKIYDSSIFNKGNVLDNTNDGQVAVQILTRVDVNLIASPQEHWM